MHTRSKHSAAVLAALVRDKDLAQPGKAEHDLWLASWRPYGGRATVVIVAPCELMKEQVIETMLALHEEGFHPLMVEPIDGFTAITLRLPITVPMRMEEDEQGNARFVSMGFPSQPPTANYFGGDAA